MTHMDHQIRNSIRRKAQKTMQLYHIKLEASPRLENLGGPVTAPMPWAVRSH